MIIHSIIIRIHLNPLLACSCTLLVGNKTFKAYSSSYFITELWVLVLGGITFWNIEIGPQLGIIDKLKNELFKTKYFFNEPFSDLDWMQKIIKRCTNYHIYTKYGNLNEKVYCLCKWWVLFTLVPCPYASNNDTQTQQRAKSIINNTFKASGRLEVQSMKYSLPVFVCKNASNCRFPSDKQEKIVSRWWKNSCFLSSVFLKYWFSEKKIL